MRELIASVENFEPQVSSETKEIKEELETTSTQQDMEKLDKLVWFELVKHMDCAHVFLKRLKYYSSTMVPNGTHLEASENVQGGQQDDLK